MIKNLVYFAAGCAFLAAFWYIVPIAIDREIARQEAVKEHNCKYYGAAINKQAGREQCPPTPNG
jgi:hypothetical protein